MMYYRGTRTWISLWILFSLGISSDGLAVGYTPPPAESLQNPGFELPQTADGEIPHWQSWTVDQLTLTQGDDAGSYPVYADLDLTVPALSATQSALLGRPARSGDQQPKGWNKLISEPFLAAEGELTLTFRAFSFETRGKDKLYFSFSGPADLSSVGWSFRQRTTGYAGATLEEATTLCDQGAECRMILDTGEDAGTLFDSGVYELQVTGLPTDIGLTLTAGLHTDGSTDQPSWLYLDDALAPPEAVLRVNPGDTPEFPALEGDFVVADCLNATGVDITCEWQAVGGGWDSPRTAQGDLAFFWFPDDDPVTIHLTVTDGNGLTSTASKALHIRNAQPAVNALNLEVLAGTDGETICRFLDAGIGRYDDNGLMPGLEEQHFLVGGAELEFQQESEAAFTSGFFRIPAGIGGGLCEVLDDDGASGSDPFSVTEVAVADLAIRLGDEDRIAGEGGNETFETAHPLEVDWKYLGVIGDPEDIDVYRVISNGTSLPAGTELVVTLEGHPADYDLLVFSNGGSTEASPFFNAPFFNAPFFNAPFFNAPFFNAPFFNAQFDSVPFFNAPFFNAPFFNAPFFNAPVKKSPFFNAGEGFNRRFDELPLSEVGLAAPDGSNVSGSDISVAEIGSLSLKELQSTPGIALKSLSAEPGLNAEKVLVKVGPNETEIYVAVVGNDLAFSANQPYALSLEASSPPSQAALLAGTGFCDGERADPDIAPSPADPSTYLYGPTWSAAGSGSVAGGSTLILTQRERFELANASQASAAVDAGDFADEAAFWTDFWLQIEAYAASVDGTLVSIDGSLFAAADQNPCSVDVRNALARTIRDNYIVDPSTGNWRNPALATVVIIGGQNEVPPLAVPDETVVGNERDFTTDLWVRPGTPLAVATAEGFNLTDAFYTDLEPTPFRGRALYLEDRPVARLVETPTEILGDINAFYAIQGGSAANSGRIAYGYDFFCDGTAEVADLLGVTPRNGPPCNPFDTPWTAADLTSDWLGGGTQSCTAAMAAAPLEIANVNAHMTTYGALSANGFLEGINSGVYDDVVSTSDAQQCLDGTLTLTIGCHSGLNIPNGWALNEELQLPFDAGLDWVELLGYMIAPRGYGLGDNTVSNRGTEGLMTLVVEEITAGKPIGEALIAAKRRYVMGLRELDVHDEDSLINLALFAPPQLTFAAAGGAPPSGTSGTSANATASYTGTFELTVREGNPDGSEDYLVGSAAGGEVYDLLRFDDLGARGSWFEIFPGDAQATYGRPLQPVTLPVEDRAVAAGDTRIHGVALVSRDLPVAPCPIDGRPSCEIAATYTDLDDVDMDGLYDFNAVFPLPQHDWVVYENDLNLDSVLEPQSCVEALAPTQLGIATTLDSGERISQSLIIGAGQFRCEPTEERSDAPDQVVGQQRLYNSLEFTALHPVGSPADAQIRDADFDPPQVQIQTVVSDPATGQITAQVQATDALTGGSGIQEIIALVYWDADDNDAGTGVIESYSARPDSLTAEPFAHTFVLDNARDQRVAFQYIDGAGNLTVKSQKGTLIRAVDVEILSTEIDLINPNVMSLFIGTYCSLQTPSISVHVDGEETLSFTLDNPPAGVSVDINETTNPDNPAGPCDATVVVEGLPIPLTEYGQTLELTVEVRAPGAVGSDTEIVSAPDLLELTLPLLPSGTQGIDYPTQMPSATGGVGGYQWSITDGSLPPGLMIETDTGAISGTPTGFAGSPYSFTLTVTDAGGISDSAAADITIAPPPLIITPVDLPEGQVGEAYSATLSATGGSGSATWSLTSGALPPGLSLSAEGVISGTPTGNTRSPYAFSATLTDDSAEVVPRTIDLTIEVLPAALKILTTQLPDATKGRFYYTLLEAEGGDGHYRWRITEGRLPKGLWFKHYGKIFGIPWRTGDYELTITVEDGQGASASTTLTLNVNAPGCRHHWHWFDSPYGCHDD